MFRLAVKGVFQQKHESGISNGIAEVIPSRRKIKINLTVSLQFMFRLAVNGVFQQNLSAPSQVLVCRSRYR
uniref:Uncharacterized protein n=1 Tax=Arundo donax TaxID=35708 RepID=A0A0A9E670_ARUDO